MTQTRTCLGCWGDTCAAEEYEIIQCQPVSGMAILESDEDGLPVVFIAVPVAVLLIVMTLLTLVWRNQRNRGSKVCTQPERDLFPSQITQMIDNPIYDPREDDDLNYEEVTFQAEPYSRLQNRATKPTHLPFSAWPGNTDGRFGSAYMDGDDMLPIDSGYQTVLTSEENYELVVGSYFNCLSDIQECGKKHPSSRPLQDSDVSLPMYVDAEIMHNNVDGMYMDTMDTTNDGKDGIQIPLDTYTDLYSTSNDTQDMYLDGLYIRSTRDSLPQRCGLRSNNKKNGAEVPPIGATYMDVCPSATDVQDAYMDVGLDYEIVKDEGLIYESL